MGSLRLTSITNESEIISLIQGYFSGGSELFRHLGMEVTAVSDDGIEARFCPRVEHAGAASETGPFGGVITTILDSLFGLAVMVELKAPTPIATVNLRTDFVGVPPGREPLLFTAQCTDLDDSLARTQGICTTELGGAPVARSFATFAIGTKGPVLDTGMVVEVPGDG